MQNKQIDELRKALGQRYEEERQAVAEIVEQKKATTAEAVEQKSAGFDWHSDDGVHNQMWGLFE